jgi:hypothetical protein
MAMRRTAALAVLLLAGACTDGARSTSVDASLSGGDEMEAPFFGGDANQEIVDAASTVVGRDAEFGVGLDATDLDAPALGPVDASCDSDAGGEGGLCPLPRSQCADGRWLVYFDNGACVSGQCSWEQRYVDCSTIGCFLGACRLPLTK